jgi:hypothetical protein
MPTETKQKETTNTTNDLFMNFGNMISQPDPIQTISTISSTPTMKQLFKNNEITILVSTNRVYDGSSVTNFYISNNIPKQLTNVKVNFLVSKHLVFKVISTNSNILESLQSLGIKKVYFINSRKYQ